MSGDAPEGDTVVKHDRKVTDNNSVSSVVEHTTCTREVMGSIPTGVSLTFQLKIDTVLPPSDHSKDFNTASACTVWCRTGSSSVSQQSISRVATGVKAKHLVSPRTET